MSRRALVFTSVLVVCAAAAAAPSCIDETTPLAAVCDTGSPTLSIVSPIDGACIALNGTSTDLLPVVVNAGNFQIRPPGSCNGCVNCGHVLLNVDGSFNNAATSSIVDVDFTQIADHFEQGLKLTVELVDDCGNPWTPLSVDGGAAPCDAGVSEGRAPVPPVSVEITTSPSCGGTSSSSAAASSSSSSGGAGGMNAGDGG